MDTGLNPYVALALTLLLIALNAFFVAVEFALVKVRSTRLSELANEGKGSARMALHAVHHLNVYLSASQVGISLASIALGYVGEPAIWGLIHQAFPKAPIPHGVGIAIALAVVTSFHIVLGEQAPKNWAIQRSEQAAVLLAYPLHAFYMLFRPAIWLLERATTLLLRFLRLPPGDEHELAHSEEELKLIVQASGQSGVLKDSEVDLVKHVFEFADKKATEIMVPRVDMIYLDVKWPLERNLEVVRDHTFTRFPLCEGGPDNVVGMIHIKDLLGVEQRRVGLLDIKRELVQVPEGKSIDQLLREFQLRKMHMAIVFDEYGGTSGLVTLEDVVEQIVGEIHDEHEEPNPEVQALENGDLLVDGKVMLIDLKANYEVEISPNGSETVGGWVVDQLGTIPDAGAAAEADGYRVEVREVEGQRVRKVLISRIHVAEPELVEA
jgi:CBS domain containing-hemolysin-like protein